MAPGVSSQASSEDLQVDTAGKIKDGQANGVTVVDDEDLDHYDNRLLSRSSSMTSLHSRAMTSEEGQVHRLGQNLRRDFLSPSRSNISSSPSSADEDHVLSLHERLEQLQEEQAGPSFGSVDANKAMEGLGWTVDELWKIQKQDREAFARFKQSQIAAQINSGGRKRSSSDSPQDSEKPISQ